MLFVPVKKKLYNSIVSLIAELLDIKVPEWCKLPRTEMGIT